MRSHSLDKGSARRGAVQPNFPAAISGVPCSRAPFPERREAGADASLEAIARVAGLGIGTPYRRFPTRDKLEAASRFSETLPPLEALRAWLRLFVDYIATKQVMSPVLTLLASGTSELYAESGVLLKSAIASLVDRAGEIRLDIDPLDLLRALAGVAGISSAPGWEESARRLVDILIAGVRIPPAD